MIRRWPYIRLRSPIVLALGLVLVSPKIASSQAMVRFGSGDSLRILSSGPAYVPGEKPGLLIDYNAFVPLDDTLKLRQTALALWHILRSKIDSLNPPFVVLRATDRDPAITGYQQVHMYGTVIEKRHDKWYLLHDSVTVDHR